MKDNHTDPETGPPEKPRGRSIKRPIPMEINTNFQKLDPDWAMGLKQLYNSVVDEPLPDAFTELLSRLDEKDLG